MCGPCSVPLGSRSLGHGFGHDVPLWGGGEERSRLLVVRATLFQVPPGFLAYIAADVACRGVVSADITYRASQGRPVPVPKRLCRGGCSLPWAASPWPGGRAGPPVLGRAAADGLGGTQFASILRTLSFSGGSCVSWSISLCQFSWIPNRTISFRSLIGLSRSGGSEFPTAVKGAGSLVRTLNDFLDYPLLARRWVM